MKVRFVNGPLNGKVRTIADPAPVFRIRLKEKPPDPREDRYSCSGRAGEIAAETGKTVLVFYEWTN